MSIETEKWEAVRAAVLRDGKVILRADTPGPYADDIALAQKVAVLPEALALLKRLDRRGGLGLEEHEAIQDILKRAGVLK